MDIANLIPAALDAVQKMLPALSQLVGVQKDTAIGKVVDFVVQAAPVVAEEYRDLKPIVTNIITVLRSDPSTHMSQLDQLEEAEKILDQNFDDAAAAAIAEDEKAAGGS